MTNENKPEPEIDAGRTNDDDPTTEDFVNLHDESPGQDTGHTSQTKGNQNDGAAKTASSPEGDKVKILEDELAKAKDQLMRTLADSENLRKRTQRERVDAGKYAVSSFAKDLLDFADNFRRAIESIPEELRNQDDRMKNLVGGISAMERDLLKTFEKHGIQKMEPHGEVFDPNYHEVMFEADAPDKKPGTIIQVIEPGYMLHDRLLRPARVGVAKDSGGEKHGAGQHLDQEA